MAGRSLVDTDFVCAVGLRQRFVTGGPEGNHLRFLPRHMAIDAIVRGGSFLTVLAGVAAETAGGEDRQIALETMHVVAVQAGHCVAVLKAPAAAQKANLVAVDFGFRILIETGVAGGAHRDLRLAAEPRRIAEIRMFLDTHAMALLTGDAGKKLRSGERAVTFHAGGLDLAVEINFAVYIAGTVNPTGGQ